MHKRFSWRGAFAATAPLAVLPVAAVIAADYVSVDAAQRAAFAQAERFTPVALQLSAQQRQAVDALAGPQPRRGNLQVWRAEAAGKALGYFFVDEVLGRQDLITYAVGIDAEGVAAMQHLTGKCFVDFPKIDVGDANGERRQRFHTTRTRSRLLKAGRLALG